MKIIIHGGFFSESDQSHEVKVAKQNSLKNIAQKAFDYLQSNSAFNTVAYAVSLLEDDALFNAGIGSQIQSDGIIRMSAAIMDGETQKLSGVINIQDVKNPVFVAKDLMKEEDRVLGGSGAKKYASGHGFEDFSTEIPQRRKEYEAKINNGGKGTVGCVAIDKDGKLAVATSTGGKGFEIPGRISDSATVAGNYANSFCAVSCTGVGEDIVSNATATKIVTRVTDGMKLKDAFHKTFEELKTIDGFAGAIALDKDGNIYHQDSYPTMVFASFDGENFEIFN
ncbi:isoaspartyl peptidase/L-asparaginase [Chryseobacterium sp. B21-037]|uniref:isoaspartyl peptidase/L-asparaginase n=1 Tax=unclassified Chryseobacterium TaxID=2593645 RepID=UPI00235A2DF4|nr:MULTISPECIES: isoaspartyl peptidase/L-asparaginase [unclassified Chryseobacterium]MDC8104246.1 isoaspartyl peptidase/L-asparaginase [Chryseobacterium sp. B21-037]MDQ1803854.1 isoaspartyl peptidase/L-asparaginase [Chryseobacterium sp. CKR4-1]